MYIQMMVQQNIVLCAYNLHDGRARCDRTMANGRHTYMYIYIPTYMYFLFLFVMVISFSICRTVPVIRATALCVHPSRRSLCARLNSIAPSTIL